MILFSLFGRDNGKLFFDVVVVVVVDLLLSYRYMDLILPSTHTSETHTSDVVEMHSVIHSCKRDTNFHTGVRFIPLSWGLFSSLAAFIPLTRGVYSGVYSQVLFFSLVGLIPLSR